MKDLSNMIEKKNFYAKSAKTNLMMAKALKEKDVSSWSVYLNKAKQDMAEASVFAVDIKEEMTHRESYWSEQTVIFDTEIHIKIAV